MPLGLCPYLDSRKLSVPDLFETNLKIIDNINKCRSGCDAEML